MPATPNPPSLPELPEMPPNLEWSSRLAQEWAQEHLEFLQNSNPTLFKSLSQSGALPEHLHTVGETAASQQSQAHGAAIKETNSLPYMERVAELQSRRLSAREIIRHDLIHQPLPE